ncbi:MAG: Stp1/IreP family PP2C-type Ser/Thr phosphatase [Bacillota bacterium]|nr:Stp1/IreP family PP2C-type Ser/Thr phosphatase [Bacillota bacterium]
MVSLWGLTDRGLVRRDNQDACAYELREGAYAWAVVCDGMGGAAAGDLASAMAVSRFRNHMVCLEEPEEYQEEGALLVQATEAANRAVYLKAGTNRAYAGMGTTLVGALLRENTLWVVNVGDSRAYHITRGVIQRITRDHSVVEDLVRKGDITPEEARHHPQKNLITRALGTARQVQVDLFQRQVEEGDAVLLCSDGLVNVVTDEEIRKEILAGGTPEEICRRLLARTLEEGAPDNVTIVLLQL